MASSWREQDYLFRKKEHLSQDCIVDPQDIRLLPKAGEKKSKKGKQPMKSAILTLVLL